jgi:hypothetical protein
MTNSPNDIYKVILNLCSRYTDFVKYINLYSFLREIRTLEPEWSPVKLENIHEHQTISRQSLEGQMVDQCRVFVGLYRQFRKNILC